MNSRSENLTSRRRFPTIPKVRWLPISAIWLGRSGSSMFLWGHSVTESETLGNTENGSERVLKEAEAG